MQPPSPNIFSVHWTTDAVVGHPQRPREGRHGPESGHTKWGPRHRPNEKYLISPRRPARNPLLKDFGGSGSHTFRCGDRTAVAGDRTTGSARGGVDDWPRQPSSPLLPWVPLSREVSMSQVEVSGQVSPNGDDAEPLQALKAPGSADAFLAELLQTVKAACNGTPGVPMSTGHPGVAGEVAAALNELVELNSGLTGELQRVARVVGRDGRMTERVRIGAVGGAWAVAVEAVNSLVDDLVRPTNEVARVISAVAEGDLSQKMALTIEGRPVKGEFQRIGRVVNSMVDQLSSFSSEVSRVAREVGTEGKLGGQARVEGVSGTWKDLTHSVNLMASNLTDQVRNIALVTTAVANGDLSKKITVDALGEVAELKETVNTMVDQLGSFADEVTRVAREVGTDGRLGGQAKVGGVSGTWKDLTDSVNFMASNLTDQVRNIAQMATAVARGDLSQKITVEAKGEVAALAETINSMTDTLRAFANEVTRVAREVGTEGALGGQAEVEGVSGTWKDLTDSVNFMAANLTSQVRNIAQVTTAVARGDLSLEITVDVY